MALGNIRTRTYDTNYQSLSDVNECSSEICDQTSKQENLPEHEDQDKLEEMPNFSTFVKRFKGHNSNSETSNLPAGKFSKTRYVGENKNGKKRSKQSRYFSESEIPKRTIPEIEVYDATGGRLSESKNSVSHWKRGSRLIINLGWGRKKSLDNDKSDAQTSSKIANTGISMRPTASAAVLGNRPSEGHLSAKGRIPLRMSEVSLATYRAMLPSKLSDISLTSYFGVSRYSSSVSFTSYPSTSAFKVQCNLCLCDIPSTDMYELQDCKCVFCKECMVQYVSIHVNDGNVVISCPDANCHRKGVLSCTEVESLLDKEVFDKFLRFKFNTEVDQDPTKTWCPSPGCETVCHVSVKEGSKFPPSARCDKCGHEFCSRCKRQCHPNQTCDEFAKLNATQSLVEIGMTSGEGVQLIKRCPVCRVPIERNEGCAQMMCKRCKHVFCWYCLTSLDDDFLLRHYDKGPCKNKLGHSRASIIWHRAQVIGIFAGFGVLLLVASPLLLLAAPCILCCKCTTCNKYCEENSESSTITEN